MIDLAPAKNFTEKAFSDVGLAKSANPATNSPSTVSEITNSSEIWLRRNS
jgi:hypothetical protein